MTRMKLILMGTVSAAAFQHAAKDMTLSRLKTSTARSTLWASSHHEHIDTDTDEENGLWRKDTASCSRRLFIASAACIAASAISADVTSAHQVDLTTASSSSLELPWKVDPVNKRFGVTVIDAERAGYNVAFVTYLSRFLLNFDPNCQRWWFSTKIPSKSSPKDIEELRIKQFASFSASVEVALQEDGYATANDDGPEHLLENLIQRYGKVSGSINDASDDSASTDNERRLARSARRQLALAFALLEENQPVKQITKLLASVDNGGVTSVKMMNNTTVTSGYEIDKAPKVLIPPPEAGEKYESAEGRAILKPTGKLLRIDIVDGGGGYSRSSPPNIMISGDTPAKAKANIATNGSIESIKFIDAGSGYADKERIKIQVTKPNGGEAAQLSPVLDMAIDKIEIIKKGTGYAVEKPLKILVEPPTTNLTKDKDSQYIQVGVAYPTAEKTSFTAFRRDSDKKKILELEEQFETKYNMDIPKQVSGIDGELPPLPFWNGGKSSSAELLRLLPAGIGLEYDTVLKRYVLSADTDFLKQYPAALQQSNRPVGFEYGPRGRAPIERDVELGLAAYLRFGLSGALCASGIHTCLTPLDVLKTKSQVNSEKYPNLGLTFKTVWNDEGPSTLFTGWLPTYTGNFVAGGFLYAVTEFTRRSLSQAAGVDALSLEVPIILLAAAIASSINAVLICPFDAVRIRTVAQPDYSDNSVGVLKRMLKEEGFGSLVNAIPVFLTRQIPYAMTKFLVFDLSTEKMYELFPAAKEELKLSLLISLVGGILGGSAAAVISNPADTVISELKKSKSDISSFEAVNNLLERSGPSAFFVGLPLRMVFYSLNASLTFALYDSVKFLLGIGSDDLKLYLDVLGGAINDSPLV